MSSFIRDIDGDCVTSIRCNGRTFHILMSPSSLHDSPITAAGYGKFLEAVPKRMRRRT